MDGRLGRPQIRSECCADAKLLSLKPGIKPRPSSLQSCGHRTYWQEYRAKFIISLGVLCSVHGRKQETLYIILCLIGVLAHTSADMYHSSVFYLQ
jgi:hypothetical protein